MTNAADIPRATEMYQRYAQYMQAQRVLSGVDPKILGFQIISAGTGPGPSMPLLVSAEGIAYPPQMLDAIRDAVAKRMTALNEELQRLGFAPVGEHAD